MRFFLSLSYKQIKIEREKKLRLVGVFITQTYLCIVIV